MQWRLVLGVVAFVAWAPASLLGLPCAALLLAAPGAAPRIRGLGGLLGGASLGLLVVAWHGRLAAVISTYALLTTAAFVIGALLAPAGFLRQALRAMSAAAAATALLVWAIWGAGAWEALAWEATRQAAEAMRNLASSPEASAWYDPIVRFVSATTPGMLVLQTLAGLALAWQLHTRLATAPLGPPLAPFREFRLGDGWVWALVAWLGLLVAPVSSALKVAGENVGFVVGTLYVLRGAAVVVAFAQAIGISAAALTIAASVAAALALPLLFLLPGLCTLGITDTWYEYRRRLAASRPNAT
jgi:hypothetical protein